MILSVSSLNCSRTSRPPKQSFNKMSIILSQCDDAIQTPPPPMSLSRDLYNNY